jgi:branched-chain amino acid transport system substrate-binding protein
MQQGTRQPKGPKPPQPPNPPPPDRRRIIAAGALALLLLTAVGWFVFIRPEDEHADAAGRRLAGTITVGAMYPLEGTNKEESEDIIKGERFAAYYINSRDDLKLPPPALPGGTGLRGARLKLVARDSGERCHAAETFNRLVHADNAVAVLGAYESTITLRGILAANNAKVPLVSEMASAAFLTERPQEPGEQLGGCPETQPDPRPSDWFFRVGPNDRQAAQEFLSLFAANSTRTNRKPRAMILHESSDIYGNSAARVTEVLAREAGMTTQKLPYHTVLGGQGKSLCRRLATLVHKIATATPAPDVLFAASYPPDAIAAVQTMKQEGDYTPPALLTFGGGFLSKSFIAGAAKRSARCSKLPTTDPSGIVSRALWSRRIALSRRVTRPIVEAFESRFGEQMNARSAAGFTAMLTVAQAISDAGSRKPSRIRDALRNLDLPGKSTIMPWRGIKFDTNGQNTKARFVLQQIIDGDYVDVYPDDLAARFAIWPLRLARK